MYGLVGQYAGYSDKELDSVQTTKWLFQFAGPVYDPNDSKAVDIGQGIAAAIAGKRKNLSASDVYNALNSQAGFKNGSGLQVILKGGGNLDTSQCKLCEFKTKETKHGGSFAAGVNTGVLNRP